MIKLLHTDCMDYMRTVDDKHFDLTLTDPPYNVGREYNSHNDSMTNYKEWCNEWFNELLRISHTVVMTVGYKNFGFWMQYEPRHIIIWSKPNQNSPSPLGGFNAYEPVLYFGKLHKRIGHDLFVSNIKIQKDAEFHNCPKEIGAWKKILNMCIDKPAKIFDPFLGSGTTAIACNDLELDLVGCEIDKDYYEATVKRFENHKQQLVIF